MEKSKKDRSVDNIIDLYVMITQARLRRDPLFNAWREDRLKDAQEILRCDYGINYSEKFGDANIKKIIERGHGVTLKNKGAGVPFSMPNPIGSTFQFNSRGECRLKFDINLTHVSLKRDRGHILKEIDSVIKFAISHRDSLPGLQPFPGTVSDIRRDLALLDYYENIKGQETDRLLQAGRKVGMLGPKEKVIDAARKTITKISLLVYGEKTVQNSAKQSTFPCTDCPDRDSKRCPCEKLDDYYKRDFASKYKSSYSGLGIPISLEDYEKKKITRRKMSAAE